MAEVDEQADPVAGRVEEIVNLRAVFVGEFLHCVQFQDDLIVANEIRLEFTAEFAALVYCIRVPIAAEVRTGCPAIQTLTMHS